MAPISNGPPEPPEREPADLYIARARVLLDQGRPELARSELVRALAVEPDNAVPHVLLAWCCYAEKDFRVAEKEAKEGLRLDPNLEEAQRLLGEVYIANGRPKEAMKAANEALRLNPLAPDVHVLMAAIRYSARQWKEALAATEQALSLDPLNMRAAAIRADALQRLGKRQEARAQHDRLLAQEPGSALSHTEKGWALLHDNCPREALYHLREALRLDPQSTEAREGFVNALHARNLIYRGLLNLFLRVARLDRTRLLVLGAVIFVAGTVLPGLWISDSMQRFNTGRGLAAVWLLLVILPWLIQALFDCVLLCDPHGRYALTPDRAKAAATIGASLSAGLILVGAGWMMGIIRFVYTGLCTAALSIPIAAVSHMRPSRPRAFLRILTMLQALFITAGLLLPGRYGETFIGVAALGFVIAFWTIVFTYRAV